MKKILFGTIFALVMIVSSGFAYADVWVNGYYRSNGTYVKGHYRSSPDSNPYNNYSFPGNTNPYTGNTAPGNADTYLNYYGGSSGGSSGGSNYYYSLPTPTPKPSCPLFSSYNSLSGSCECYSGYVVSGSSCVSGLTYCWSKYGINSNYSSLSNSCECDSGYELKYGICTRIEKATTYDYSNYYSNIESGVSCPSNASSSGGSCVCNQGYTSNGTSCVTYTEACQSKYGTNTYGDKDYCYCKAGYIWNTEKTFCYIALTPPPTPFTNTPAPTPSSNPRVTPTPQLNSAAAAVPILNIQDKPQNEIKLESNTAESLKDNEFYAEGSELVRECPEKACKVARRSNKGDLIRLIESGQDWFKVLSLRNDRVAEGWLHSSLVPEGKNPIIEAVELSMKDKEDNILKRFWKWLFE